MPCLEFNWVWIAEVTPLKYPNSVDVVEDTATFPLPSDTNARDTVKLEVIIVVAPPVIASCFPLNVLQSVEDNAPLLTELAVGTLRVITGVVVLLATVLVKSEPVVPIVKAATLTTEPGPLGPVGPVTPLLPVGPVGPVTP